MSLGGQGKGNKLAKARKMRKPPGTLSLKKFGLGNLWVKILAIHFRKIHFRKIHYRKIHFQKIHLRKIYFRKIHGLVLEMLAHLKRKLLLAWSFHFSDNVLHEIILLLQPLTGMPCPPGFVITYGSYDHIAGKGSYSKNQKVKLAFRFLHIYWSQLLAKWAISILSHVFSKDIFACANECKKKGKRSCCSFEWSESAGLCKLHQSCKNDQTRFADFFTCRKEGRVWRSN